ncbi:hypothetical protein [Petroclostridium sp. X23]|uniref:phage tail assembly chaperone n=1 Tax=Petroclostridium sp. X23 TaxID=3045146 RepID=UPI0024ACEB71|nr:hypothetical protein [Petroclostridium sp. X23]WHH58312.1 hypothetical protein QKW49_21310 [Petroclostridium sp. X23]
MKDYENDVDTEITKEEILMSEQDLLQGLLAAAEDKEDTSNALPIEIARKGKVLFRFRIRPLGEDEYNKQREKATKYVRNKSMGGLKMPESTDAVRYRSYLIYTATIEEDRKKLWDNKEAWTQLKVINGPDLIDKVLLAGEKDAILEKLDEISGYSSNIEEVSKK